MIGEKIKAARQKIGITQKQLAERLGTSPQNLAQYENGKRQPKLETLEKIAEALGVDVWDLYEGMAESFSAAMDISVKATVDDEPMLYAYHKLNYLGQGKVIEYAEDLALIQKYQKEENE